MKKMNVFYFKFYKNIKVKKNNKKINNISDNLVKNIKDYDNSFQTIKLLDLKNINNPQYTTDYIYEIFINLKSSEVF